MTKLSEGIIFLGKRDISVYGKLCVKTSLNIIVFWKFGGKTGMKSDCGRQ